MNAAKNKNKEGKPQVGLSPYVGNGFRFICFGVYFCLTMARSTALSYCFVLALALELGTSRPLSTRSGTFVKRLRLKGTGNSTMSYAVAS